MNEQYVTIQEYIDIFRAEVGDTDCSISNEFIVMAVNRALMEVIQTKGLDKLSKYHDTYELASINNDGTNATSFYLDGGPDGSPEIGTILDIYNVSLIDTQSCEPCPYHLCYMEPEDFHSLIAFPEANVGCTPCKFTIEYINNKYKITFDAPIPPKMTLDIIYSSIPPKITGDDPNQLIRIPRGFMNLYDTLVQIYYYEKASDFASARALREDSDMELANARELLARRKRILPPRRMRGAFHNG